MIASCAIRLSGGGRHGAPVTARLAARVGPRLSLGFGLGAAERYVPLSDAGLGRVAFVYDRWGARRLGGLMQSDSPHAVGSRPSTVTVVHRGVENDPIVEAQGVATA